MKAISSLLMGLILASINLYLLVQIIRRVTAQISKKKLVFLVAAKFLVFFGLIALILWKGHVSPLPFLAGFSIPLVVYLCMNLHGSG